MIVMLTNLVIMITAILVLGYISRTSYNFNAYV